MESHKTDPILLVCADQDRTFEILEKLYDGGFTTVGAAPSARVALTLAAQTMPRIAILAGQTSGRRSAAELAAELTRTWGVECFLMDLEPDAASQAGGELEPGAMTAIRNALGGVNLRPARLQ
jgi:uncharacterized protein YbjT (DUF2867 family)